MLVPLQVGVSLKKKSKAKALLNHAIGVDGIARRASVWNPQLACGMESTKGGMESSCRDVWNLGPVGYTPFGASARSALGASHSAWLRQAAEERSALARLNASIQTRFV